MVDLHLELSNKLEDLDKCLKSLRIKGTELAQAERDYKVALKKKVVEMRAEKISLGEINLTIYGIDEIAELRYKRDIAETIYDANKESINVIKLQIKIISEQLNKEYGQIKYE